MGAPGEGEMDSGQAYFGIRWRAMKLFDTTRFNGPGKKRWMMNQCRLNGTCRNRAGMSGECDLPGS
jgi:hypothetical protein